MTLLLIILSCEVLFHICYLRSRLEHVNDKIKTKNRLDRSDNKWTWVILINAKQIYEYLYKSVCVAPLELIRTYANAHAHHTQTYENHYNFKWLWLIHNVSCLFAHCTCTHIDWSDNALKYHIIIRNTIRRHSIRSIWILNMLSSALQVWRFVCNICASEEGFIFGWWFLGFMLVRIDILSNRNVFPIRKFECNAADQCYIWFSYYTSKYRISYSPFEIEIHTGYKYSTKCFDMNYIAGYCTYQKPDIAPVILSWCWISLSLSLCLRTLSFFFHHFKWLKYVVASICLLPSSIIFMLFWAKNNE